MNLDSIKEKYFFRDEDVLKEYEIKLLKLKELYKAYTKLLSDYESSGNKESYFRMEVWKPYEMIENERGRWDKNLSKEADAVARKIGFRWETFRKLMYSFG